MLLPKLAAGRGIERMEIGTVVNLQIAVAVDDAGGKLADESFDGPLYLTGGYVAFRCRVDRREHSHLVAVEIFLAVRGDDRGAVQNRRGVDGALAHQEVPHRL